MDPKWYLLLFGFHLLVIEILGTPVSTEPPPAKGEHKREVSSSSEEKDKRSQEDIMFGNQQNKPAGMVDDILSFPDRKQPTGKDAEGTLSKNSTEDQSTEKGVKSDVSSEETRESINDTSSSSSSSRSRSDDGEEGLDYYDYLGDLDESRSFESASPSSSKISSSGARNSAPPLFLYDLNDEVGDYSNYDYNNGLYRRKRSLKRRALSLRKRSLHSNLDDLLRNRRLHRRALRVKRDAAHVEDLLAWLSTLPRDETGSDGRYSDGKLTISSHLPTPDLISSLPLDGDDLDQGEYFNGLPTPSERYSEHYYIPNSLDAALEDDPMSGVLPAADYSVPYYDHPADESEPEEIPQWAWFPGPSREINVVRRSTQPFYPIDYRLIPLSGQKKRSSFKNHELPSSDLGQFGGRWGKIVERRAEPIRNPESEDDMEKLYALANLLAEADESEYRYRKRRST